MATRKWLWAAPAPAAILVPKCGAVRVLLGAMEQYFPLPTHLTRASHQHGPRYEVPDTLAQRHGRYQWIPSDSQKPGRRLEESGLHLTHSFSSLLINDTSPRLARLDRSKRLLLHCRWQPRTPRDRTAMPGQRRQAGGRGQRFSIPAVPGARYSILYSILIPNDPRIVITTSAELRLCPRKPQRITKYRLGARPKGEAGVAQAPARGSLRWPGTSRPGRILGVGGVAGRGFQKPRPAARGTCSGGEGRPQVGRCSTASSSPDPAPTLLASGPSWHRG